MSFITSHVAPTRKPRLMSVLDIGSSKIVCLIARLRPKLDQAEESQDLYARSHHVEVLGFGMRQARGIKAGCVVDLAAAEQAIRLAVDGAEKQAGLVVDSVIVNMSAGRPESHLLKAHISLADEAISGRDIRRVLACASQQAFELDRPIIHSLPVSYRLDGEGGIEDPTDMFGSSLGVDIHVASVESTALRNLEHCVNRAHLSVESLVLTPLASALAVMVGDEAQLGAACIDMGADTTTIALFLAGKFVHARVIPVGAHHITRDIARGLSIAVEEAERLKVIHGSAHMEETDERHLISLPPRDISLQEETSPVLPAQYPRALLSKIIRARCDEIIELAQNELARCGFGQTAGNKVILTGGGAQMTGLIEVARRVFGPRTRLGRPLGISGLPDVARGSAFSSAVGLLIYPQMNGFDHLKMQPVLSMETKGRGLKRVGQWLRASF